MLCELEEQIPMTWVFPRTPWFGNFAFYKAEWVGRTGWEGLAFLSEFSRSYGSFEDGQGQGKTGNERSALDDFIAHHSFGRNKYSVNRKNYWLGLLVGMSHYELGMYAGPYDNENQEWLWPIYHKWTVKTASGNNIVSGVSMTVLLTTVKTLRGLNGNTETTQPTALGAILRQAGWASSGHGKGSVCTVPQWPLLYLLPSGVPLASLNEWL